MNRREFIKGAAYSIAAITLAQTTMGAEDQECHLICDLLSFEEYPYRVGDKKWCAYWRYTRDGTPLLHAWYGGSLKSPILSWFKECGLANCLRSAVARRARKIIEQEMDRMDWGPGASRLAVTVPRWVAEML